MLATFDSVEYEYKILYNVRAFGLLLAAAPVNVSLQQLWVMYRHTVLFFVLFLVLNKFHSSRQIIN